jgi:hypothetical protein
LNIWWDHSLSLALDREDVKLLKEMDFIVRSMISKKQRAPKYQYENRFTENPFSARVIYN